MGLLERILSEFDQKGEPEDRPLVTLSYAQSLDGSIAARRGRALQISGDQSAVFTHQLRANHDSILVGVGTVLSDDPHLTVRLVDGLHPQPVILDSTLRTPVDSFLVKSRRPWIATTNKADPQKAEALATLGVQVYTLPMENDRRVRLQDLLDQLHQLGVERLMVEGGAQVISSFISNQLVDYMIVTVSPMIVGGLPAIQMPDGYFVRASGEFPRLMDASSEYFGDDLIVFGRIEWPESRRH